MAASLRDWVKRVGGLREGWGRFWSAYAIFRFKGFLPLSPPPRSFSPTPSSVLFFPPLSFSSFFSPSPPPF